MADSAPILPRPFCVLIMSTLPTVTPAQLDRIARIASWILMAIALVMVLKLQLLTSLLAGLLVYELIRATIPMLEKVIPGPRARWLAVVLIATIIIGLLTLMTLGLTSLIRYEINNPSALLVKLMDALDRARDQLPPFVVSYLPDNVEEFRADLINWLQDHLAELQAIGKNAAHIFVTMLIGMVLGAMIPLHQTHYGFPTRPLSRELTMRMEHLASAFHNIVFAQIKISLVNTVLTSLFLVVGLPLFGIEMPLTKTLIVVTFFAGLLPVVGNLISNTVIFLVGLSVSLWVAVIALSYLVIIHKLEYFLNARIVGTEINAKAWELLLAMLLMEAAFGIPGLVAAPVFYAYIKRELSAGSMI